MEKLMAKIAYPSTTLKPIQTMDFLLSNGMIVGAIFLPEPDATGTLVAHVAVEGIPAGTTFQAPLPNQRQPQNVLEAAMLAYLFAQSESARKGLSIIKVRLRGEEFLEKIDVYHLTHSLYPVDVI